MSPESRPGSERSAGIDDIFNDALELSGSERERFLAEACHDDPTLRQKVSELLKLADQASETWLKTLRTQHGTGEFNPASELTRRIIGNPPRLGRYDVLEWIDEGGMGAVYRAHHRRLDKTVAIKFLLHERGPDSEWLDRFQHEAQLLARLDHPNIARIYDFDQERNVPFLVMEFIEGSTLEQILQERSRKSLEGRDRNSETQWAINLCRQIAQAIHHAHSQRIVHLDLKPANVMITSEGVAKVLDFGIARTFLASGPVDSPAPPEGAQSIVSDPLPELPDTHSTFAGTPQFMSPEQQDREPVGPASDIWSLGCILFDCCVDSIPRGIEERSNRDLSRLPSELPVRIRRIIASCLDERPECRPDSADKVDRALQPPGENEHGVRSGTETSLSRPNESNDGSGAHKRTSRSRLRLYVWGVVALAAVAVTIFSTRNASPGPVAIENIQEDVVRALGPEGEVLWIRKMPARVLVNQRHNGLRTVEPAPPTIIQPGNKTRGVLIATAPGVAAGKLSLLDPHTGETIWSHKPAWTSPVNDMGFPHYTWTDYIRWPGHRDPVILACIGVSPWYPTALEVIDLQGNTLGVYHHPGPLWLEAQADLNSDGHETLLFSAINSSARFDHRLAATETDQHIGCLIILDPRDFGGQGWPYTKGLPDDRDWPDLEPANEVVYLALPLVHPEVASHGLVVDIGVQDGETTIRVETRDGRMFFMDKNLRPHACHVEAGGIASEYRESGQATFLPLLYRHRGQEELVDVPLIR